MFKRYNWKAKIIILDKKKQDPTIRWLQEIYFKYKSNILKLKRCKKIYHVNINQKDRIGRLLSDKVYFGRNVIINIHKDKKVNSLRRQNNPKGP